MICQIGSLPLRIYLRARDGIFHPFSQSGQNKSEQQAIVRFLKIGFLKWINWARKGSKDRIVIFQEITGAIDAVIETITDTLSKWEKVTLVGFGAFQV
ncbi:MAG: HU family DNA-binding protein, partial [bacterium]